jgi:hypothetical protein
VSRFLRDRLQIGVEPGKVTLVRLARPGSRRVLDCATHTCAGGDSEMATVAKELALSRWRGTRVSIVISDFLTRYLVAPVPAGARTISEVHYATRLRLEDIYGNDGASWMLRMDLAPWAPNLLGCALPSTLVDGLSEICRAASLPLDSIAPFGISEFNRHHRSMAFRSGWFVAIEPSSIWMALKSRIGWHYVQTRRPSTEGLAAISRWIAQGELRAGMDKQRVPAPRITGLVGNDRALDKRLPNARCLDSGLWPGQESSWSSEYRLALSPVWPRCA